ncbi:MAG: hypothetical protein OEV00_04250 [Acidobacteriota bacterium]|nr:hypothetical protein [Acidobacteriota bacterium]MDH3784524.1 hypothetical protein [Acidobacteriota bacterium]
MRADGGSSRWWQGCIGCAVVVLIGGVIGLVSLFMLSRATTRQLTEPEHGLERALETLGLVEPPEGFNYGFAVQVPWASRVTMLSSEPIGSTHWDSDGRPGQYLLVTEVRSSKLWESWLSDPDELFVAVDEQFRDFLEFDIGPGQLLRQSGPSPKELPERIYRISEGGVHPTSTGWGSVAIVALRCTPVDRPIILVWARAMVDAPDPVVVDELLVGPPAPIVGSEAAELIDRELDRETVSRLLASLRLCP